MSDTVLQAKNNKERMKTLPGTMETTKETTTKAMMTRKRSTVKRMTTPTAKKLLVPLKKGATRNRIVW